MRNRKLIIAIASLMLLLAACGGNSVEEEILEQMLENSGEDIGDIDIDTSGDGDNFNMTVEGEDGEEITITGGGDDEEFTVTMEGEDGGTMSIGGGDIPDGLTRRRRRRCLDVIRERSRHEPDAALPGSGLRTAGGLLRRAVPFR